MSAARQTAGPPALQLLFRRIETGKRKGEKGFVLDGFPRTVVQSQELMDSHDIQLAVNLSLRQEVLIEKCMGRRICRKCGKGWNLADIYLPGGDGRPPIVMPPLDPPVDCRPFMEQREDDKEAVCCRVRACVCVEATAGVEQGVCMTDRSA